MKYIPQWVTYILIFALIVFADSHDMVGAQAAPGNFIIPQDQALRNPSQVRPAPTYTDVMVLVANTPAVWTAPANTRFVILSSNCAEFYANLNAAAAVPAANVSNGTGSELNPAAWYFSTPVTTIGFASPTACKVTIAAYLGRAE